MMRLYGILENESTDINEVKANIKLSLCLIKHNAIKTYEEVEV
jgi:hypothetical protein